MKISEMGKDDVLPYVPVGYENKLGSRDIWLKMRAAGIERNLRSVRGCLTRCRLIGEVCYSAGYHKYWVSAHEPAAWLDKPEKSRK